MLKHYNKDTTGTTNKASETNVNKSESNILSSVEINPAGPAKKSVILLHGLGADGHDFAPLVQQLGLPDRLSTRFVLPHADIRPVTINQGYKMRAWYDITGHDFHQKADEMGIQTSIEAIKKLIDKEKTMGIPSDQIVLAGFSQGALIALRTGLSLNQRIGGIIALSGYLPEPEAALIQSSTANKQTPIFIGHGTADFVVPYVLGEAMFSVLRHAAYPVEMHTYKDMAHNVCPEEIRDISLWIDKI